MTYKNLSKAVLIMAFTTILKADDGLKDFEFSSDPDEVMIAQESRQYQTIVKPPVRIIRPKGITNSHRPQYNLDSFEDNLTTENLEEFFEATTRKSISKNYKSTNNLRAKESMIKDAVLRALERKDHVGKFAQILPIVRAMSGSQRVALASLVASQVSTPPGRAPLNLAQVRSMFGNDANTTADLMLPILLDMANLIRRAVGPGKETREVTLPFLLPHAQLLRRSFVEDAPIDGEPFETEHTTKASQTIRDRFRRVRPQRTIQTYTKNRTNTINSSQDKNITNSKQNDTGDKLNVTRRVATDDKKNMSLLTTTMEPTTQYSTARAKSLTTSKVLLDNGTLDLTADATNQSLAQDLPVAEKLRALNRFIDRKGNFIRRGTYPPKPVSASRRTTAEPSFNTVTRRRPVPVKKLPPTSAGEQAKCELFTNTLCLHAEDYPTEAIVQSIRRNKAAAGALLADFKDPGEGAVDGVTAAQEAKYTAEHYLVSNRRGDTANRDFAGAGEAGFMCPSTVKYARPQRARATSGQWKYIVNTGEHTQTLRLEKCLKPKEPCTYLTDNFKSKCVQVYNYHRLLTWDQPNGLHMDIFKVPTCCSCHIEGYSVSFPPLGHRIHESSAEHFPGEDLSSEHGNHAFETVQSSIQRPSVVKNKPFSLNKPVESFPSFGDNHNMLSGTTFTNGKVNDNDEFNPGNLPPSSPMDSYGNSYFPDSFNQASSVRSVKKPIGRNPIGVSGFDSVTLPSYLEPPTPSAPSSFNFLKETPNKYKIITAQFKRGAIRLNRRPIRKKIGGPDDLISSGTSAIESLSNSNLEAMEDFNDDIEEPEVTNGNIDTNLPKRPTIAPKLQAVTIEQTSTTFRSVDQNKSLKENNTSNGKKVNYNYHPIIDFFEEDEKEEEESIDREDNESTYIPSSESEWKPINHPPSRNIQRTNLVARKKQK